MHLAAYARALVAGTIAASALAAPVFAHASVVKASPADGATVTVSQVGSVVIIYDDDLDPAKSKFIVVDAGGATVATGAVIAASAKTMEADRLTLAPGAYETRWTAVAPDGDLTRGTIAFTVVANPAPTPTAVLNSSPTSTPTTIASVAPSTPTLAPTLAPSAAASPPTAEASGSTPPVVAGAALVLVAIAAWFLVRRNRS